MLQKPIKLENICRQWKKYQNLINIGLQSLEKGQKYLTSFMDVPFSFEKTLHPSEETQFVDGLFVRGNLHEHTAHIEQSHKVRLCLDVAYLQNIEDKKLMKLHLKIFRAFKPRGHSNISTYLPIKSNRNYNLNQMLFPNRPGIQLFITFAVNTFS